MLNAYYIDEMVLINIDQEIPSRWQDFTRKVVEAALLVAWKGDA